MSDAIEKTLASQLGRLSQIVQYANVEGDIGGLQAQHFLESMASEGEIDWQVNCANDRWVFDNRIYLQRGDFGRLASLGYSLSYRLPSELSGHSAVFIQGMEQLRRRDLFPADQVAFANMPRVFLGIVLGVLSLPNDGRTKELLRWLTEVVRMAKSKDRGARTERLLYEYIDALLNSKVVSIGRHDSSFSLVETALTDWGRRKGVFDVGAVESEVTSLQEELLVQTCSTILDDLPAGDAGVVWSTVSWCVASSIHDSVMATPHVVRILTRFESSLRRWRWDERGKSTPVRWPVTEEREVQDVVWLIMRSAYDDVIDEDTLPKVGHSSYRADFGVPSIATLVEVKFARSAGDFRRIEKEVMEDSVGYLQETRTYERLVVFIYDDSASVQEHAVTRRALERLPNIEGVVIVSRPSQLPGSTEQRKWLSF